MLHVLGGLNPGGVETWLLELARHADGSGWAFDFCLLGPEKGAYADELERRGSRIWRCPVRRPELFMQRLYRLLRRTRYDIVHSHVHYFSGWVPSASGSDTTGRVIRTRTCCRRCTARSS